MTWLKRSWRPLPDRDENKAIYIKRLKFQQILRNYGRVLKLIADAAEKQGGGFVIDQSYIVSLAEEIFNLTKALLFDFMTVTGKHRSDYFDIMENFEREGRQILASKPDEKETGRRLDAITLKNGANTEALAQSLAKYPVLYRDVGQVAAWGVAAGTVFNLKTGSNPEEFPEGGIWTSQDLKHAVELSRVVGRVRAILSDGGEPGDYVCRVARSERIPTIVGMKNVTERLKTGDVITVDADENVVYQGFIPELLEHYRGRVGVEPEEEIEYQILRNFRRKAFPLTIHHIRDHLPEAGDVVSLHDLIHLASEKAGEALAHAVIAAHGAKKSPIAEFFLDDETGAIKEAPLNSGSESVSSIPFAAFLEGIKDYENKSSPKYDSKKDRRIIALTNKREAALIMPSKSGFDIIDAATSGNELSNYIYCRFDSRFRDIDQRFVRQNAALDILTRLNFAVAATNRAVSTWIALKTQSEIEKQMVILGRLWGFLDEKDRVGWKREKLSAQVDEFIRGHTR